MKIVFVSGMLPSGHYSQYITSGLTHSANVELLVYTDKDDKNLAVTGCGTIKPVWSKSFAYISEILAAVRADKPDIIHLQHELNMYGGMFTAALFPLLVLLLRLDGFPVVVTVHAAVYKAQIDEKFVETFHKNSKIVRPIFLKVFFHVLYKLISVVSSTLIVHTHLAQDILVKSYSVNADRIKVIPAAIPTKKIDNTKKEKYFFYFGYMVRRKGLGYALDGFKQYINKHKDSDFKFVLAGGVIKGQEKAYEEICEMVEQTGLSDRIILRGFIEETEQDDLYMKAYAVVIPAILSMGYSGPLYHAQSYGKCIIATKMGHYIEILEDGKTGILTENNAWEKAFDIAVSNPDMVSQIEKNVEQSTKLQSPKMTAQAYIKLYNSHLIK